MLSKPWFMYPPVYVGVFLLAQWWLSINYPLVNLGLPAWVFWLGAGLIGLALLIPFLINLQFRRAETSIIPYKECDAIITDGFFAYSRNPIYLMMAVGLIGSGLMFDALSGLLIVVLFPIIIQWRFIRAEEATVEAAFGEEYRAYKAKVRRWI